MVTGTVNSDRGVKKSRESNELVVQIALSKWSTLIKNQIIHTVGQSVG